VTRRLVTAVGARDEVRGHVAGTRTLLHVAEEQLAAATRKV
jgi:hypothetical protein